MECGAWCEIHIVKPPSSGLATDTVGLHRHAGKSLADHRDLGDRFGAFARVATVLAELGGEAHVGPGVGEQQRGRFLESVGGRHHGLERCDVDRDGVGRVVGMGA
jgi:hypothetical protein